MITVEMIKARVNALVDEQLRIEGAIREGKHLIEWLEKEKQGAVEPVVNKPVEVPAEAKE
jgi:hypothetical protein